MNLQLQKSTYKNQNSTLKITGSKSETNRLLLLQALYPNITLENTSNSDDSEVMAGALNSQFTIHHSQLIDVHHAGTAMRFLTAFFAIQEGKEVVLTGSSRMKERPIKILVEALQQLGAEITYEENEGFPPIKIIGKKLTQSKVSLPANVSSQYISALLLIAPKLENGLELTLEGEITSIPYIKMTLQLLNEIGVETSFENNKITICHAELVSASNLTIESDWSSASYWYSIVALSQIGTQITLSSYKENSLQGDSALVEIYKNFGVETVFENNSITISKTAICNLKSVNCNLQSSPDIAQTIAVTSFGLGIGCHLTGLHTLKIKETDRLEALKIELSKLGATISITNDSLTIEQSNNLNSNVTIATYQDHRMAMAFAPLALKVSIIIKDAEVVSKSYPTFWEDLESIGFQLEKK
ncbi:3-phosphoshikimate 1-carboxyvinyltransferase [Flavobacterium aquatile]|uniref:3-phosphoshikimate 1-carboxyvinyltransferase n=1 Tax=Flavobacterium aquatile LMG 4008 = ATCC 11947 TaxID=1453498 RepID=A0A095SXY6_9FLAO|nr:3-phosphoshikimate 1-carboxyvinyltransferase [Flavobacterium aquatile]KGD69432.1 3-phosphoshikimate 1-carboxyvinyltransferase [Flavobacterium aquatile LMG 4008 = ATCC 11947]OXA66112.1 3-phosphoshikimate 1-carboxyvinyltransferase [Flavobacterium aquatile LMG 4008 = ATCC 11947]GEC77597.1 3-phosphoshikimate 1-carboxyvinyltransferase [Flavobacterium aquatile]